MSISYGVTEYPNTFKRQSDVPLDITDKFESITEAEEYAANNPIAYAGQIISIKESNDTYRAYILQSSSDDSKRFIIELLSNDMLEDEEIIFDCGDANIKLNL